MAGSTDGSEQSSWKERRSSRLDVGHDVVTAFGLVSGCYERALPFMEASRRLQSFAQAIDMYPIFLYATAPQCSRYLSPSLSLPLPLPLPLPL